MLWREERQSDGKEEGKGVPMSGSSYINGCLLITKGGRRARARARGRLTDFLARSTHTQPKVLAVLMIRNAKEDFCSSTTGRREGTTNDLPLDQFRLPLCLTTLINLDQKSTSSLSSFCLGDDGRGHVTRNCLHALAPSKHVTVSKKKSNDRWITQHAASRRKDEEPENLPLDGGVSRTGPRSPVFASVAFQDS
jgi:hypothetical protein